MIKAVVKLAFVAVGGALLAGYAGRLHPAGDSFAVFRSQAVLGLVGLAALGYGLGLRRWAGMGVAAAVIAGVPMALAYWQGQAAGELRLYQKNMLFRNDNLAGLEADIRTAAPDVLTLQEVSAANEPMLVALADVLPHQLLCPFASVGGVAVATRLMPVAGQTVCAEGLAAMQVQSATGPLWLVSVHLYWPWPHRQAAQVEILLPMIAALQGPVVVAGDFNMVAWSATLARFRAAARAGQAGPVLGSFAQFAPFAVLAIDNVLAPGGGEISLRPELGSDHRGLLGLLTLEALD